jgi:flavin-dependent dehydrogenase
MADFDVLIVGSGPAGSALAILLSETGKSVLLVDKSIFPRDKVCGECISPGALNILNKLGIKAELDKLNVEKVTGVTFRSPDLRSAKVYYPGDQYGYAISRRLLDKLLLDYARNKHNITVIEGFNLKNVSVENEQVIITGEKDKNTMSFTGSVLAGADGRYSTVAKLLGIYKLQAETSRHVYVATLENIKELSSNIELEIKDKKIQYLISKQANNLASIAVVINDPGFKKGMNKEIYLQLIKQSFFLKNRLGNINFETQLKGIALQKYSLNSLALARVLFIGDSAGFIDPITGEGMYRAFKSAAFASETIIKAFEKNDFSQNFLSVYQKKLLEEFQSIYTFIKTAVFLTTNEPVADFLVKNMNSFEELGEKLVSLQGAIIPGKELFSFNTFKLLLHALGNKINYV